MRTEKILLALGCALALGLIALCGWLLHRSAAADALNAAQQRLHSAAQFHLAQQASRARELMLVTRQLADDKGFVGYIAQAVQQGAAGSIDAASIRDLLDERRSQLGIDVAMVLDSRGKTLVDTASYQTSQPDLAHNAAVAQVLADLTPASGYLLGRERLMQIAVAPLLLGSGSEGMLLSGRLIDDAFAAQTGGLGATDIALIGTTSDGPRVLASTLDAALRQPLADSVAAQRGKAPGQPLSSYAQLNGSQWLLQQQPAGSDAAAGTLVTLLPADSVAALSAASQRQLRWSGAVLAACVLLAALAALWPLLALDRLSRAAAQINAGALEPVPRRGHSGIGRIGRALGRLVGELRETRDFEAYSGDLLRQRTRGSETAPRSAAPAAIDHGAAAQAQPGSELGGRYEIYARVGAGQSGVVYRALDRQHSEVVALKLLGAQAVANADHANRLQQLLRAGARVQHANVARIRDAGQIDGLIYVASEYVRGISLKDALARTGRIPLYAGLRVAREICAGLGAIHAAGTVHGALNPANIVLAPGAATKLLDLGLIAAPPGFRRDHPAAPLRSDPTYLSPQQILGQFATPADDVYAFGLILTGIFTALLPQPNHSAGELCIARIERDPLPPSRLWTEIPPLIETLLLRCLERDPARRLADALAVQAELEKCRL
jgi:eukaryotic-like serine/threonine-protein kinase